MVFALALLALADQFEDAANQVKFPSDEVLASWSKKGELEKKLVKMATDRRSWARAFETINKKLTLGPGKIDIDVVFTEDDNQRLAESKGQFGFGTVRFNMKLLVPALKQLEDTDAQTKQGRIAPLIIPTQRLEGMITHELTHILSGSSADLWVAEGLACYAANDDYFLYGFTKRGGKIEVIDRPMNEADAYPRGLSFFRWVEKEYGADKVQDLAVRLASGTEKTREVVADVLGKPWDQIVAREKTWSTTYLAGFATSR